MKILSSPTFFNALCRYTDISEKFLISLQHSGIIPPDISYKIIKQDRDHHGKAYTLYAFLRTAGLDEDLPKLKEALRISGNHRALDMLENAERELPDKTFTDGVASYSEASPVMNTVTPEELKNKEMYKNPHEDIDEWFEQPDNPSPGSLSSIWIKLFFSSFKKKESKFLSSLKFQSCLGLGGFGIVLQAIDTTTIHNPTTTAVKFIFPPVSDETEKEQILQKCHLASNFNHPNIVKILNVARTEFTVSDIEKIFKYLPKDDERYFEFRDLYLAKAKRLKTVESICIQMQLCGETLREWLHLDHDNTSKWVQKLQIPICRGIVAGLKYLHDQKIIHWDLKPENIMFSSNKFELPVKLGDFGLCRNLHSNPEVETDSGFMSRGGTMEYVAPEAFSSDYTFQVDLYSLGLVIWEVVQLIKFQKRRVLFDALVNERDEGVVQLPKVFSALSQPIINLTKKKTSERAQGLDQVSQIIEEIYQKVVVGFANTSKELEMSLRDVESGGRIVLGEGLFQGPFVLQTNGVEILGQGPRKTLLKGLACLTVTGSGCTISGLTIISDDNLFLNSKGIYLIGSRNRIHNLEVSGGLTCVYVEGNENRLEELTIPNALRGIQIQGSYNILNHIKIKCAEQLPRQSIGIEVAGFNNNLSHVHLTKGSADGRRLNGVWLRSSGSHNSVSNLICSGYSRDQRDCALRMDSPNSSIKDSDCGPIRVDGSESSLINVNCREEISLHENATGVSLTNCRGQKLKRTREVATPDCHFGQIVWKDVLLPLSVSRSHPKWHQFISELTGGLSSLSQTTTKLSVPAEKRIIRDPSKSKLSKIRKLLSDHNSGAALICPIEEFILAQQELYPMANYSEDDFISEFCSEGVHPFAINFDYALQFQFNWLVQPTTIGTRSEYKNFTTTDVQNPKTQIKQIVELNDELDKILRIYRQSASGSVRVISEGYGMEKTSLCHNFIYTLKSTFGPGNIVVTWLAAQTSRLLQTSMIQFCEWRGIKSKDSGGFPLPFRDLVSYAGHYVSKLKDKQWIVVMDGAKSKDYDKDAQLFQDWGAFVLITTDEEVSPGKQFLKIESINPQDTYLQAINSITPEQDCGNVAIQLLRILSLLHEHGVEATFLYKILSFTSKNPPADFAGGLSLLTHHGLIQRHNGMIFIHPFVQKICRQSETLDCEGIIHILLSNEVISAATSSNEISHVISIWEVAVSSDKEENVPRHSSTALSIFNRLDDLNLILIQIEFSNYAYQLFLDVKELGPENLYTLKMEHNIARALQRNGEYRKALERAVLVLKKEVDLLGDEDELTFVTSSLIASILWCMKDYEGSLELQTEIFESMINSLGPKHDMTRGNYKEMKYLLSNLKDGEDVKWKQYFDRVSMWMGSYPDLVDKTDETLVTFESGYGSR